MERIDRQVSLANNVVTALSNFAKLPEPLCQPTEVVQLLAGVLATTTLPDNVDVAIDVPDGIPDVLVDENQLPIVFRNLLRNARDAMPNGGHLAITASHSNGNVRITVADSGIGMSDEVVQQILEPLFTTKARGMGLGLAISQAIVEQHKGKLEVTSRLGQGSTFTVTLQSTEGPQKEYP